MASNPNQGTGTGAATKQKILIEVLKTVFNKAAEEAVVLMMKVHREGSAVVGAYSYDEAMTKASMAVSMARQSGFPLNVTCEPE